MKADMQEALQGIIFDLTTGIATATTNANNKAVYAQTQGDYTKTQGDYAKSKGQEAQAIVTSAAPIINNNLQASYSDKSTAQTGTFITCPTSDDGLVHIKKIEGETKQVVTVKGKNIIPKTAKTATTINGITFTPQPDGSILINGTATANADFVLVGSYSSTIEIFKLPSGTYILKGTGLVGVSIHVGTTGATTISTANSNVSATTTEDKSIVYSLIRVNMGTVVTNLTVYPQLELGSTSTTYEPFTPNSPSHEYPSPLLYAKDFNLMSTNVNLLQKTTNGLSVQNGITFTPNLDGSVTVNGTATTNSDFYFFGAFSGYNTTFFKLKSGETYTFKHSGMVGVQMKLLMNSPTIQKEILNTVTSSLTRTFTEDKNVFGLYVTVVSGTVVSNLRIYPQLVLGSTDLAYTEHKEVKVGISFPFMSVPLSKNSYEIVNEIFTSRVRVKEYVFDGTESFVRDTTNVNGKGRFKLPITDVVKSLDNTNGHVRCSHFDNISANHTWLCTKDGISANTTSAAIHIYKAEWSEWTVAQFKAWVLEQYTKGTPLTVQYQLASTIVTEIPIIYLKSFKGTAHLLTTSDQQVTMTADFKSELWSRDYLQDKSLSNALYMLDEVDTSGVLLTDSELLGGKPKSYFEQLVQAVSDRVTANLASINAINNNVTFLTLKSPWEIYLSEPLLYVKAGKMRIISGTIYNPSATAANSQIAILPEVLNTARFSVYDKTPIRYSAHMSGTMLNMESTVPANSIINFIAIGYLT